MHWYQDYYTDLDILGVKKVSGYSVYKIATGRIVKHLSVQPDMLNANLESDEAAIAGHHNASEYKVVNDELVALTDNDTLAEREADAWARMRVNRTQELIASDWTQANDSPLSDANKAAWRTYRQALRDLPDNITDILNYTMPTKP